MATTKRPKTRTSPSKSVPKDVSNSNAGASTTRTTPPAHSPGEAHSAVEARSAARSTTPDPDAVDPAEVEREAYLIWLEHGGNEVVNWLEAERRIRTRHGLGIAR